MRTTLEEEAPPLFNIGATLGVIWARKLIVLAVALAALLAAFAYLAVTRPVYTATATILLDPRDSRATNLPSVLPGIGADSAAISSQLSVIDSADLLSTVFRGENLENDPEFNRRGLLSTLTGGGAPTRASAFASFRSRVNAEREGLTYIINISFKSADREKAARIVNAIVARYRATLASEKENANSEANSLLTGKLGELEKAVADAERAVQDFKFQHRIFDASAGGTLQSQIDQLSSQIVTAQEQLDQANAIYRQAAGAGNGPEGLARLSKILSSSASDKLYDDYNQRAAALSSLRAVLGPRHPSILRLSAELDSIRGQVSSETVRITEELKARRDIAQQNFGQIQVKLDGLRQKVNLSDLDQVQLRQLQRQADAARSVLDDFLKRSQETLHMEGMQTSQVRVVSEATAPTQATWPKPMLVLLAAVLFGLMLGCAIALLLGMPSPPAAGRGEIPPSGPSRGGLFGGLLSRSARPFRPKRKLTNLGSFKVPPAAGASLQDNLKAIRREVSRFEDVGFLQSVERLLEHIADRLPGHEAPFVLRISAPSNGPQRRLAAALVGIGLDYIHRQLLVVDMSPRAAGRGAQPAFAVPFYDSGSGLRTVVLDPGAVQDEQSGDIDAVLARYVQGYRDEAVDFLIVVDRPLDEIGREAAIGTDLTLLAFAPGEWTEDVIDWVEHLLPADELERSAALVMETEAIRSARRGERRQAEEMPSRERRQNGAFRAGFRG